eukprot:GHUV01020581.1.p2 GENE.GHUV01020581.1~~GHUV01020581.1.p2  ORF type:complete len:121 (+),score=17.64 GHUV01020581.1:32-364(+)
MASAGPGLNASQFYVTLSDSLDSLDERHTVFGAVSEGLDVLEALNEVPVDNAGRPLQNIRYSQGSQRERGAGLTAPRSMHSYVPLSVLSILSLPNWIPASLAARGATSPE